MADHEVRAQLVPADPAADIDALATAVDAVAGTDTVTVDRGLDLVVSIDLVVTDAVLATAEGIVDNVVADAGVIAAGGVEVFSQIAESDPVLSAPSDVTLDISDGTPVVRTYSVTLSEGAKIASIAITVNEIPSEAAVVSRGNPQGHESQKSSDNTFDITYGPAVAGDEVGSPHNVSVTVTDTNGRTSAADTVAVTVQA